MPIGELSAIIVAIATVAIAFFTYTLWRATSGLFKVAEEQSRDMKASIAVAEKAAEASMKSAEVAEKTLVNIQRPWIKIINMRLNGPNPIIFAAEAINLNVIYQLINVGITPAVDVKILLKMFIKDCDQDMITPEKLRNICLEKVDIIPGLTVAAGIMGYIFPNEPSREASISGFFPISYIERTMQRKIQTFKSILIVGRVTYKFPFDETIHVTGGLYSLVRKDGTPIFPAKKDDSFLADGIARQIEADKLNMECIWYGYAD
ncbi:MAG: hypothetical protein ACLQUW_00700 [Desulfobaccales bacterium]